MQKIKVRDITGFSGTLPLRIYDEDKKPFYFREQRNGNTAAFFNLPEGTFYSPTAIKKTEGVIKYKLPEKTPIFEKNRIRPNEYKLTFGENPNKASVFLSNEKMIILIDKQFRKKGRLFTDFIIRHELGHFFYKTEKFADMAAYICMINEGFNPSQIFYACALTLNRGLSFERIENIFNLNVNTKWI